MTSSWELLWLGKQRVILKGTAVTSVIMLLMLPSFSISGLCLPPTNAFASDSASLCLSPPALTTIESIGQLRVGQQFILITSVTNQEDFARPLVAITEVLDSEGVVESIGLVSASVDNSTRVG